jgi:hypothetical protein
VPHTRRVAIIQSNYIPWKGYFDLVASVDECILLDDVQYTRSDWRNRNRIKTPLGVRWLTIPVAVSGRRHQTIREAMTVDSSWAARHWQLLQHSYARAPGFADLSATLKQAYTDVPTGLSAINRRFIDLVMTRLGITTALTSSAAYELIQGRTERLVHLCRQAGATEYLTGPAARSYLDESLFHAAGIAVRYMRYDDYPEYPQLYGPFDHAVSVLDLLCSVGQDAPRYLRPLLRA